jgi:hypothetical protein
LLNNLAAQPSNDGAAVNPEARRKSCFANKAVRKAPTSKTDLVITTHVHDPVIG